jgi:Glutamine amidotransferases class-II
MCLAIYKPQGAKVPEDHLRNGFHTHSDGAGFAWLADGKINVKKGIFNMEEAVEFYKTIEQYPALIHFRKATSGKVDATNCHPFIFNDGKLALIHNGVISIKCHIEGLSDTAHFVKLVLEPLVKGYNVPINNGALNYLISTAIGTDKVAILSETGDCYIFNEDKGEWDGPTDGKVWYSNGSYKWSSWRTSSSTTTNTHRHSTTYAPAASTGGRYDSHRNWKKRFQDDGEGDESYLEFWKRSIPVDSNPLAETQKMPTLKLLTSGAALATSSETDTTVMTVEEANAELDEIQGTSSKISAEVGPGHMMEYGWWDEDIENDVALLTLKGMKREAALIEIFNGK